MVTFKYLENRLNSYDTTVPFLIESMSVSRLEDYLMMVIEPYETLVTRVKNTLNYYKSQLNEFSNLPIRIIDTNKITNKDNLLSLCRKNDDLRKFFELSIPELYKEFNWCYGIGDATKSYKIKYELHSLGGRDNNKYNYTRSDYVYYIDIDDRNQIKFEHITSDLAKLLINYANQIKINYE